MPNDSIARFRLRLYQNTLFFDFETLVFLLLGSHFHLDALTRTPNDPAMPIR